MNERIDWSTAVLYRYDRQRQSDGSVRYLVKDRVGNSGMFTTAVLRKHGLLRGYNVYEVNDGCVEIFCGFALNLREARHLAATGNGLPRHLYDTARAAGHVDGLYAPDTVNEDESPDSWFGVGGRFCATAVYAE